MISIRQKLLMGAGSGGIEYIGSGGMENLSIASMEDIQEPVHNSGDLLILVISNTSAPSAPSSSFGYTEILRAAMGYGVAGRNIYVAYRIGNGTRQTMTLGVSAGYVVAFRGVSNLVQSNTYREGGFPPQASTSKSLPELSGVKPNSLVVGGTYRGPTTENGTGIINSISGLDMEVLDNIVVASLGSKSANYSGGTLSLSEAAYGLTFMLEFD